MKTNDGKIDAARIELLLGELRLPGVKLVWSAPTASAMVDSAIGTPSRAYRSAWRFKG
jgi:hypothetical protein